MELKIGDVVRAEDFEPMEGRKPCYKIGEVTRVGKSNFTFKVLFDVWTGELYEKSELIGEEMVTVLPDETSLYNQGWEWDGRVRVLIPAEIWLKQKEVI